MSNPIFTNEKSTRSLSEFEFIHSPSDKNSKLGIGSFASVKLAKEKKSGKQHAIKIIAMDPAKITSSDLHNIRTEITVHRSLDHPNIIQFHDYIQKDHNVYLVLEYAESGNLYSYIHKRKSLLPEEIFRFFYQTCLAVQYLHQNDVLHRDLKPENLLLDKHRNLKLCDFGWSARRITEKRLTFCGTYEYMAPEIVQKKPYDYRVDIWSLGVLLYELIHKEAPYKGRSLSEITKSLSKSHIEFGPSAHPEAKDLILKILRTNPTDRLSIAQILSHPWVQSHLSPEEDDSLQVEEFVLSPRELRPANMQSVYCESPKQIVRRDNENFKSEIIMTSNDGIFGEILESKTRKNSHNHLYSSFNMPCSTKNKDRSKDRTQDREKKEKSKFVNIAKTLNQSEAHSKAPLQESAFNGVSNKPNDENLSVLREHIKSSPSLAQKALEKAGLDEKTIRSNLEKKRKIFENNLLSPTFRTKVDSIMLELSSHTTTHKMTDRTPSLLTSKHQPAQTPASEVPIGFKYSDENTFYGASSSMRAKTDQESTRGLSMRNNIKSTFQKKIGLVKADTFSSLASPIAHTTLTTRSKMNSRGSDVLDQENLASPKFFVGEVTKSMTTKNFGNVLGSSDQNKFKGHDRFGSDIFLKKLQKEYGSKKKPSVKTSQEISSGTLHISSLSERRNENKENKKELIREKENPLKFREEYAGRWEF